MRIETILKAAMAIGLILSIGNNWGECIIYALALAAFEYDDWKEKQTKL